MTPEQECDALVDELRMVWRVTAPAGGELSGADLLRWRRLPPQEQAYFRALLAPYHDPHYATRVSLPPRIEADGRITPMFDPPYPEPCGCGSPVFRDCNSDSARCSRCLRTWGLGRERMRCALDPAARVGAWLSYPLLDSVNRKDMGYAIERLPR